MKKLIPKALAVGILLGGTWYISQSYQKKFQTVDRTASKTVSLKSVPVSAVPDGKVSEQSEFYVRIEVPPVGYEGFCDLPNGERLRVVTAAMNSKRSLDTEEYAFFKAELFNREHCPTTRNNMANALVNARDKNARHPDPELHEAFITMLEDKTEDPVWRDYCIQFLSSHLPNSSDPKRVRAIIAKYSKGNDLLAGTALVQMNLQDQDGVAPADDSYNDTLAEKLENPNSAPASKLSILGIMGKRRDVKHLPLIRKYAKQDENASLKRVAIAAIGTIGASPETRDSITDSDKAIVTDGLSHKNRAVQLAAKGALKRLDSTVTR